MMLAGIESDYRGVDVVVSGPSTDPGTGLLISAARSGYMPGLLILRADPDDPLPDSLAVFTRGMGEEVSAALCRDGTCGLPVGTAEELLELLDEY